MLRILGGVEEIVEFNTLLGGCFVVDLGDPPFDSSPDALTLRHLWSSSLVLGERLSLGFLYYFNFHYVLLSRPLGYRRVVWTAVLHRGEETGQKHDGDDRHKRDYRNNSPPRAAKGFRSVLTHLDVFSINLNDPLCHTHLLFL